MKNWYEYPQKIKSWNVGIDYVMFIDENGNTGRLNDIFKKITNGLNIDEDNKYFTITGCIFEKKNYSKTRNNIRKLKNQYWNNGYYYDTKHDETKYVCLHSRDIRRHDGAFNDSLIEHQQFCKDLTKVLKEVDCKIISITINLVEYLKQGNLQSVYEAAFDLLLDRYIYTTENHKKGIIMLESRGKKEDKILLKHIYNVFYESGRKRISTKELQEKIIGVYFNPKWYGGYSSTYCGLEIADLFSYPIHQYIKYNKENSSFKIIEPKFAEYPNYKDKGLKLYPKEKDE